MGMAGIPWWTTDIGGFVGGDPTDPAFRELLVRWFEWGAFCPVMRLHGDRTPKKPRHGDAIGATCLSGADNEVWSFGEEAYGICTRYLRIRERIRPYVRVLMDQAHLRGTPVMRPMFFGFPQDARAWECEDQYLFGPDLLVAPVLEAGAATRAVYLPLGADWKDVWTGATHPGGRTVEAYAPLDRIPLFVRTDASMDLAAMIAGEPG